MIKSLIILILLVVVLSLLGVDFSGVSENPTIKGNFQTLWGWATHVYFIYLQDPLIRWTSKLLNWLTKGKETAAILELYS